MEGAGSHMRAFHPSEAAKSVPQPRHVASSSLRPQLLPAMEGAGSHRRAFHPREDERPSRSRQIRAKSAPNSSPPFGTERGTLFNLIHRRLPFLQRCRRWSLRQIRHSIFAVSLPYAAR
uniref:Uncharacterized protein n=1 Tax=Zea mays TaxID=4577 RepID=A0A804QX41_MAIZE